MGKYTIDTENAQFDATSSSGSSNGGMNVP